MNTNATTPVVKTSDAPPPPLRPGNPEAAKAIWNWSEAGSGIADPARLAAQARKEGIVRGVIGGVAGVLIYLFWHETLAFVVWGIAGVTTAAALVSPTGIYRAIQTGINKFAGAVGTAISWILLPIFFYGFCLLFGLVARRGRKDRMERWFDNGLRSYWKDRKDPARNVDFYKRQF